MPSRNLHSAFNPSRTGRFCPGWPFGRVCRIPLGRPVVPEEYNIPAPSCSSGTGSAGWRAIASSKHSKGPSGSPPMPATSHRSTFGHSAGSFDATSALAAQVSTTRACESLMMKAASCADK